MSIKKGSVGLGAPYFQAENHVSDEALIVEPRSIRKQVVTNFKDDDGNVIIRDECTAYVTAFKNLSSLQEGRAYFSQLVILSNNKLVADCERLLEDGKADGDEAPAAIVRLDRWKAPNGKRRIWIFKELTAGDAYDAAFDYYHDRENKVADAIANAPSFDD